MKNRHPRSDDPQPIVVEPEVIGGELTDLTCTLRFGAKALFYSGGRVLLTEEQRVDGSTFWTLPGGGVKPREPLTDGLHRELEEELRCFARISDTVGRCRYRHATRPNVVTHYTIFSGTLITRPEANPEEGILNYEWVDTDNLPEMTLEPFRQIVQDYDCCDSQMTHTVGCLSVKHSGIPGDRISARRYSQQYHSRIPNSSTSEEGLKMEPQGATVGSSECPNSDRTPDT